MKISIVTINYNNAEGLKRTIDSVLTQTYKNIEYIIIDGGSTDHSVDLIKNSSGVSYWVSEKDKGVFDAQNKGLKSAHGDYVLVLNSGDELADPEVLEKVFSQPQNADILYGNMIIVGADGKRETGLMPASVTFEHMIRDTLWHPVSFVKREFLEKVGYYNTQYKVVADYEWFLRAIFLNKATLRYIDLAVSVFYLGGMSSDPKNTAALHKERVQAQDKIFGSEKMQDYRSKEKRKTNNIFYRILRRIKG